MERELIAGALLAVILVAALLFRQRTAKGPARVDPADFGLAGDRPAVVAFTSPYCIPCRHWRERLESEPISTTFVDVSERPDLARRYHVHATPLVLLVDATGRVEKQWFGEPPARLTLAG